MSRRGPRLLAEQGNAVLKRAFARKAEDRSRGVNAAKLMSESGNTLSVTVGLAGRSSVGYRLTSQGERRVKRWCRCTPIDNVGTDSQPIRSEIRVPYPRLPIQ